MAIAEWHGSGLIRAAGRVVLRSPADLAFLLFGGLGGLLAVQFVNWTIWSSGPWFVPLLVIAAVWLAMPLERLRLRLVRLRVPAPEPVAGRGPLLRFLLGGHTARHGGYLMLLIPLGFVSALVCWGLWLAAWTGVVEGRWPVLVLPPEPQPRVATRVVSIIVLVPLAIAVARLLAEAQRRIAADRLLTERRIDEVVRSRARAVDAQTVELRRIERDLHDGAQARLVALTMQLGLIGRALRPLGTDAEAAQAQLGGAVQTANAALADLRQLVRGIHPPILTDRGLPAALSALAADCALPVDLEVALVNRPPPAVEAATYFAVAEALANAAKHADAGRCRVTIGVEGGLLRAAVSDDGRGGADPHGSGLTGLRHRVEALDGDLVVASPAGGPTTIRVELPCA